jgi:hypothetical protein
MNKSRSTDPALITANIHRDDLKSFFHLLVGKPDSTLKALPGPYELSLESIETLDRQLTSKLKTHNLETDSTSVVIAFDDKTIKEFSSLNDFFAHNWTGGEKTDEITVKWDFLVSIPQFQVPQRHTLTFRAGHGPRPRDALAMMFSAQADDDKIDLAMMPAYCRVDFVNPIIGKELINLVSDWSSGLKRPVVASKTLKRLRNSRERISKFITYSMPFTTTLLCLGGLRHLLSAYPPTASVTVEILERFGLWLGASAITVLAISIVAQKLSAVCEMRLRMLPLGAVSFSFTNGDTNAHLAQVAENNRHIRDFCFGSAWALFLNILATYFAYKFGIGS